MTDSVAPSTETNEFAIPLRPDGSEDYRKQKLQATWVNMVIALAACVALMVGILMIAPQPKGDNTRVVDSVAAGQTAQDNLGWNVAYVELPEGWSSNEAHVTELGSPAQTAWYASYLGPQEQWVGVTQSHGDEKWTDSILEDYTQSGERKIAGQQFTEYQKESQQRAFAATIGDSRIIIEAVAMDESVETFAGLVIDKLEQRSQAEA